MNSHLHVNSLPLLISSEWVLTFSLRQRRGGHVVTVTSVSGATVSVEVVEEGRLALALSSGPGSRTVVETDPLPHDIFTPLVSHRDI